MWSRSRWLMTLTPSPRGLDRFRLAEAPAAERFIVIRLSEFRYADATAIAVVMLVVSFLILFAVNRLQRWAQLRVLAR